MQIDTQYDLESCKTPEEYYAEMQKEVPGEWNAELWYRKCEKLTQHRDEFAVLKYAALGGALAVLVLLALVWYAAPDALRELLWSLLSEL